MILNEDYRCPSVSYIGLFPFGIEDDCQTLVNQSGYSGPVESLSSPSDRNTISGVLGDGTFYPQSGGLDSLSRMFWCVKSWNLTVYISRVMNAGIVDCVHPLSEFALPEAVLFPPLSTFAYCGIGVYNGSFSQLPDPQILFSKTLTTQDYCSHTSDGIKLNQDSSGSCPYSEYSSVNENRNVCVPINPVQKFDDLLCRESYFSWCPTEEIVSGFNNDSTYDSLDSPYLDKILQFRVIDPSILVAGYDCDFDPLFDTCYSLFNLSIMDTKALAISGSCVKTFDGYYPDFNNSHENYRKQKCGPSGENIVDKYGVITGYGYNKDLSGYNPPLVFDNNLFNTSNESSSFNPFVLFQLKLRTQKLSVSSTNTCPINDTFSTLQFRAGQKPFGKLKINDFVSGLSNAALEATRIYEIPIYAASTISSSEYSIEAVLTPIEFWSDNKY